MNSIWTTNRRLHVDFVDGTNVVIPGGMWEFTSYGVVTSFDNFIKAPTIKLIPWPQIKSVMQFGMKED